MTTAPARSAVGLRGRPVVERTRRHGNAGPIARLGEVAAIDGAHHQGRTMLQAVSQHASVAGLQIGRSLPQEQQGLAARGRRASHPYANAEVGP